MILVAWQFVRKPTGQRLGVTTCTVDDDHVVIECGSRRAYTTLRRALERYAAPYVARFPCRAIGRDDQGKLYCVPGRVASANAEEALDAYARGLALDEIRRWDAAPPVVKRYLRAGDPKLRQATAALARTASSEGPDVRTRDAALAVWAIATPPAAGAAAWATQNSKATRAQKARRERQLRAALTRLLRE